MAVLPHPWNAYALHQSKLADRSALDDTAWGLEQSLTRFLDAGNGGHDLDRISASAARRNRYGRALLSKHASAIGGNQPDPIGQLQARSEINALTSGLPSSDVQLLYLIGAGWSSGELAADQGVAPAAIRTRLCRARVTARDLLGKLLDQGRHIGPSSPRPSADLASVTPSSATPSTRSRPSRRSSP